MSTSNKSFEILCLHVLKVGGTFNTSNGNHNAALILEDENGYKYGIEYISIEEFQNYMNDFCYSLDDGNFFKWLIDESNEDIVEGGIDFSVDDFEILQHLEHFRISEYNKSSFIEPFKDE